MRRVRDCARSRGLVRRGSSVGRNSSRPADGCSTWLPGQADIRSGSLPWSRRRCRRSRRGVDLVIDGDARTQRRPRRHRGRRLAIPLARLRGRLRDALSAPAVFAEARRGARAGRCPDLRDFCCRERTLRAAAKPEFLLRPGELLEVVRGRLRVIAYEEDTIVEQPCLCAAHLCKQSGMRRLGYNLPLKLAPRALFFQEEHDKAPRQSGRHRHADAGRRRARPSALNLIDWHIARRHRRHRRRRHHGRIADGRFRRAPRLIQTAVKHAAKRIPMIAGTGANSTREAIELSALCEERRRRCVAVGGAVLQQADAGRSVSPLPARSPRRSIIPRIVYNVPAVRSPICRTTRCCALREMPNIVGIKDATAEHERGAELLRASRRDFAVYSGDDGPASRSCCSAARALSR